jgi:hypothetical protein
MFGFKSHALKPLSQNSNASTASVRSHPRALARTIEGEVVKGPRSLASPSPLARRLSRREMHAVSRSPGASAVSLSLSLARSLSFALAWRSHLTQTRRRADSAHTTHSVCSTQHGFQKSHSTQTQNKHTHTCTHTHMQRRTAHAHASSGSSSTHARTHARGDEKEGAGGARSSLLVPVPRRGHHSSLSPSL